MELSEYVTIAVAVPESHAELVREAMLKAGAGRIGEYSCCSFSVRGMGRFVPNRRANPFVGKEGVLEEVIEERIETICNKDILEDVLEEIKKAHPYEEMNIDIFPIYKKALKTKSFG